MSVFLLCGANKCFSTVVVLSSAWYLFFLFFYAVVFSVSFFSVIF